MIDLSELLEYLRPGSRLHVRRFDDSVDLWVGANASANALASAIDACVISWGDALPIDGATAFAALPTFLTAKSARDLSGMKSAAYSQIDAQAEAERLKYVTPGEGQAMVYLQKQAETKAFQADVNPDLAHYPLIAARATATGQTPATVTAEWAARAAAWYAIAAGIETVREGAKTAVGIATTEAEISAILSGLVWPS
ncbi:MAG: hypothetical protein HQL45_14370 [Alphaproteobacteria bacterium]|nr:hypothetical protein [Alphaproteobacteria bacterium]